MKWPQLKKHLNPKSNMPITTQQLMDAASRHSRLEKLEKRVDPDRRLGLGLLYPLIYAHPSQDVNADGTPHDGDEDTHSAPSVPDTPDYGPSNVTEDDINTSMRLRHLVDAVLHQSGEAWSINTDKWAGKNRNGVIRRFSGKNAKEAANNFARNNTFQDKDISRADKGIENPSIKSTGITKTTYESTEELAERNYRQEYDRYQGSAKQKKRRAQRNKSRRTMEREGRVRKGDGKDIDHADHNPHNQSSKNLRVMSKSKNRSMN